MIDGAGLFLDNYYIGKLMMMKYPTNNENTLVQKTKKVINVCKKPAWNLWLLLISYQHLYMRATATRYNFKKITIVCKWKNKLTDLDVESK